MRVSIVTEDNMVSIDGQGFRIDCSGLGADVHAIQWHHDHGEIEFKSRFLRDERRWDRRPNEHFGDFAPYQTFVDKWQIEKAGWDEAQRKKQAEDEEFERIRFETENRLQAQLELQVTPLKSQ